MASMHAVRSVLLLKYILEELGQRGDFDTVETTLEGSAQPIPVGGRNGTHKDTDNFLVTVGHHP
jgi:hypothetical protein